MVVDWVDYGSWTRHVLAGYLKIKELIMIEFKGGGRRRRKKERKWKKIKKNN
jgi:hypothetical protein